jgi:hypothetical protein
MLPPNADPEIDFLDVFRDITMVWVGEKVEKDILCLHTTKKNV